MTPELFYHKLGHVWAANALSDVMYSHGKSRAVIDLGDRLRAYTLCYSKPDSAGLIACQTYFVDLDRDDPTKVIHVNREPVLSFGERGTFDEHGIMAEMVFKKGSEIWMYYDGWSRRSSVPYDWSIGLAISRDGGETFERYGKGPVIGPAVNEPFLFASPYVHLSDTGLSHMWYLGGDSWTTDDLGNLFSVYTFKHATSSDGIVWQRDGNSCIASLLPDECQAGPTVFQHNGQFHMIFSYRSGRRAGDNVHHYALGYAVSDDLQKWTRLGDVVAKNDTLQKDAWDSEMACYPQVLKVDERLLLFYSGNSFGRTGFGVAELLV